MPNPPAKGKRYRLVLGMGLIQQEAAVKIDIRDVVPDLPTGYMRDLNGVISQHLILGDEHE